MPNSVVVDIFELKKELVPTQGRRELEEMVYLTEHEVSEITGLAVQTLRNWRVLRIHIPFIKLSRRTVRYERRDVLDFIRQRRIEVSPGSI